VTQRLGAELEEFQRSHVAELKQATVAFATAEIEHAQRTETLWLALRDELLVIGPPEVGRGPSGLQGCE